MVGLAWSAYQVTGTCPSAAPLLSAKMDPMRPTALRKACSVAALVASLVAALSSLSLPVARAAEVNVRIQETPAAAQFARQAGLDVATLEGEVRREMENLFQTYRVADYLRSFGDAQAFASRGMGVDYVSNFRAAMVGVAGNLSLNVERGYLPQNTRTRPPAGGVSTNATVMAGVNLDFFGLAPVTLFGNYFNRSGRVEEFDADLSNWGVHAQVKLWGARGEGWLQTLLRWGGVDLTTGVERARLRLALAQDWRRDIPVGQAGQTGDTSPVVAVNSTGRFVLDMHTLSVPIEVTTSVRLLYILGLYAGFGFDWQVGGGSSLALDLDGTMIGRDASGRQPGQFDLGTATVDASEAVDASPGRLRWLAGLQINVWVLKVFAQLNLATQDPVIASVALGARVAY